MNEDNKKIAAAWLEAAIDLEIAVDSPFCLEDSDGVSIEFPALVKDFGNPKGILVFSDIDGDIRERVAEKKLYGFSRLIGGCEGYERESFIEILIDWKWARDTHDEPKWYVERKTKSSSGANRK